MIHFRAFNSHKKMLTLNPITFYFILVAFYLLISTLINYLLCLLLIYDIDIDFV